MTSIANTEKKDNTADVVIIGAGIAGLQCANHKKIHTLHKVLVLEARDRIGGGYIQQKDTDRKQMSLNTARSLFMAVSMKTCSTVSNKIRGS